MLPVDRCGPEGKVKKGAVEDFFDLTPLPSLRNERGFLWLGPHRRRSVGCKCPRRVGEAHQRMSEHGEQRGQSQRLGPSKFFIVGRRSNQNPVGYEYLTLKRVSTQKPRPVT